MVMAEKESLGFTIGNNLIYCSILPQTILLLLSANAQSCH